MISSTFVLLKGIGDTTERRLWDHGIATWAAFRSTPTIPWISTARKTLYDQQLAVADTHLAQDDSRFFTQCLKPRDHWRLYNRFRASALFLDIETTGLSADEGEVTMVGLSSGGTMTTLIRGDSLTREHLEDHFTKASVLVTFCGTLFDVPYLKAKFPGLTVDMPHIDLCFVARRLGLRGGLKHIEREMGIERPPHLQGLDGWDAVRLWHAWEAGDPQALAQLRAYNEADTINLNTLADLLYDQLVEHCTGSADHGTFVTSPQ
jgi:uncharacterized protein YprB with RNaseH-like and TPR domain